MGKGRRRCLSSALLAGAAALAGCGGGDEAAPAPPLFIPPDPPAPLTEPSAGSSLDATGCDRQTASGTVYLAAEVEPWGAANPLDARNRVVVWQQDRWSNGGAHGVVAGVSFDSGQTWALRQAPFSRCTGGNALNGGDYARATDPWMSFGPDGAVYWMAMSITETSAESIIAMLVSRSADGGNTWEAPATLIRSGDPYFNDKNSVTADPTDALHAYAVWDRLDATNDSGPVFLSRTTDGGLTWEVARAIYDPGAAAQTIGNVIAVLPDGTLVDLFTEIHFNSPAFPLLRVIRSADRGLTWSSPITIDTVESVGTYDAAARRFIRDGSLLGAIAVGPDGVLHVTWQDARFNSYPGDGIVLSHSDDGGLTWSTPTQVNQAREEQAFTPAVQVTADGTIGVTYYDLRDNPPGSAYLLVGYWLVTSTDGGATWTERRISGPFDLRIAPDAEGLFLGDYQALASAGTDFLPFFVQTRADLDDRTNVYTVALPAVVTTLAKSTTLGATSAPRVAMTTERTQQIRDNVERRRHQFPDRVKPGQLPRYLRSAG